ncbi:MAG: hypothetical protein WD273_00530 [Trueperaceae bacterium]
MQAPARALLVSAFLLSSQLLWPLVALTQPISAPAPALELVGEAELASVFGGCLSGCSGDDGSSDDEEREPRKTGYPYWEYAYRALIARPSVAGDLIWHRVNSTNQDWGPFEVSYRHLESFNWSLSGSVPKSTVQAQLGGARETVRTLSERFTIPPRTYYKFFVAYPYERWRYYYRRYQDYSDNSRDVIASGTATVYDQWTKTTLVQGLAY